MSNVGPFSFGGYRSFDAQPHRLPSVGKINLIAGPNNSGKSNVIRFIRDHYNGLLSSIGVRNPQSLEYGELDRHQGEGDGALFFSLGIELGGDEHDEIRNREDVKSAAGRKGPRLIDQILEALADDGSHAWFDFKASTPGEGLVPVYSEKLTNAISKGDWSRLWQSLTNHGQGDLHAHWIPQTFLKLCPSRTQITCRFVDAVRKIGEAGSDSEGHSGSGIIDSLAQLQNPKREDQADKERFEAVNQFLRTVLDDSTATIEIPHDRQNILVHQGNRTLPLSNLGTGVHEVVILAAAATVIEDHVICIEEPELHLHPILQRKLLDYLATKTTNQYFITTHSATLLDPEIASIYHVSHDGQASSIRLATTDAEHYRVCSDLGYKASDILQANCVIWVEGPSDRIYLRHWISAVDPELVEGVDYSIMFYGGRLLFHLTANDPVVDDFISLRRLNRHMVILIDSDRKSKGAEINDTKQRVRDELTDADGFVWITKGREVENYLPRNVRKPAILDVVKQAVEIPSVNRYHRATRWKDKNGDEFNNVDKVKLAHRVAQEDACLDFLDLREDVNEVVEYIRKANE